MLPLAWFVLLWQDQATGDYLSRVGHKISRNVEVRFLNASDVHPSPENHFPSRPARSGADRPDGLHLRAGGLGSCHAGRGLLCAGPARLGAVHERAARSTRCRPTTILTAISRSTSRLPALSRIATVRSSAQRAAAPAS